MGIGQGMRNIFSQSHDTMSGNLGVIDITHKEVHEGDHYHVISRSTASDTQVANLMIKVPNDTDVTHHAVFITEASGEAEIRLFEGSTVGSGGTTLTKYNSNRNSANASSVVFVEDDATTSTGSQIDGGYIGGSGFKSVVGGETGNRIEWILKDNTNYIYRAESKTTGNVIYQKVLWYEED